MANIQYEYIPKSIQYIQITVNPLFEWNSNMEKLWELEP